MYETEINPKRVREAEIIVGIPSLNEADTISHPVTQASIGLKRYFPDRSAVILNVDNDSEDGTRDVFLATETEIPKIYMTTPPGVRGKGYNFENMFCKAMQLGAKAVVCVDADLKSITPEWIKSFVEPILDGYDFVAPIYSRHKYDGTITNQICYPLIYGLFGMDLRQPIGGDFALSRAIAQHILLQPWHRTTEEFGIDIFCTMQAVTHPEFRIAQTGLGAKIHKPSAPKLGQMFLQVVATAFISCIETFESWRGVYAIRETSKLGLQELAPPQDLKVDREATAQTARQGFQALRPSLVAMLDESTMAKLDAAFAGEPMVVDSDLWIDVLFEAMTTFADPDRRSNVVAALAPIYFARSVTFMNDTWDMDSLDAERLIVEQAERLFERRGELIARLEAAYTKLSR